MILPSEAVERLLKLELDNRSNLVKRLCGERPYPVELSLKAPSSSQILGNLAAYENFLKSWRNFPRQDLVIRRSIAYQKGIAGDAVPCALRIDDLEGLLSLAGRSFQSRFRIFARRVDRLCALAGVDRPVFYRCLKLLFDLPEDVFEDLCILWPQLSPGMGQGRLYIRALPVKRIDTKFVETNSELVFALLQAVALSRGESFPYSDLNAYLDVARKPRGYVYLRILDPSLQSAVSGFEVLRVAAEELVDTAPPGGNLIVVENEQSGFMLPHLADTVAVFGAGKNLSWAGAEWIRNRKRVAYWGDADSWGYAMLAEFRCRTGLNCPSVLMDEATVSSHPDKRVREAESARPDTEHLFDEEIRALELLGAAADGRNRLEQEKIRQDLVVEALGRLFVLLDG